MTKAQISKFLNAAESAEIKEYAFYDDIQTKMNNHERAIIIYDEANSALINIKQTQPTGVLRENSNNNVTFMMQNIDDIRRAEVYGNYEAIKKFIDAYGLSLTNDQLEIVLKIDRNNLIVNPQTGDYHNIFHQVSKETYESFTPEQKAEYDKHMAEEKKRYDLPVGTAARITL